MSMEDKVKIYKAEIHGYPAFAIELNGLITIQRSQVVNATDNPMSLQEKIIIALCERILKCTK